MRASECQNHLAAYQHFCLMSLNTSSKSSSWGLNVKKKDKQKKKMPPIMQMPAAFGDSSDDSEDSQGERYRMKMERQKQAARERAERTLASVRGDGAGDYDENDNENDLDSSSDEVNEYDKHQEKLQSERDRAAARSAAQREEEKASGPKYMKDLLHQASLREMERDKAYTRKLIKEQKEDENLYADKEQFVTSSYKRKLAEREELERRNAVEEIDIETRKGGMGNFFRNADAIKGGQKVEGSSRDSANESPSLTIPATTEGSNITSGKSLPDPTIIYDDDEASNTFLSEHDAKYAKPAGPTREEVLQKRRADVATARKFYFAYIDSQQ